MGHLRDRGQLLVITALALAVLLSALALTLNTAVFGGVHVAETEEGLQSERAAVDLQHAVRRGVAGLLPGVNENRTEYDALNDGLAAATANWSAVAGAEYARDGVATNASISNTTFETRIVQNDSREFTDQSGNASWTVAADVDNASGYEMNVSDEDTDLANEGPSSCLNGSGGCFAVTVENVENASDSWKMYVYDPPDDSVGITVVDATGATENLSASETDVRIDVTNGTFDGDQNFTSYRDDGGGVEPPYTVTYANANNTKGTYNLTVTGRIVDGSIADDGRYDTTGSPRLDPRIVGATVTVSYQSADLTYRTTVRVTPGDTDG